MSPSLSIRRWLEPRLAGTDLHWFRAAAAEISGGAGSERFCALFSLASRHARRVLLAPDAAELAQARELVPEWNPERWNLLESVRVALLLALPDLSGEGGARILAEAFRYADEGELCALYRSLALLPEAQRFRWRAGEGCRSNMRSVFEAAALDTPYPLRHFDDLAWRQVVIKCLFVGAPLWRLAGLDSRLSPELARMALDLADERRSAGRPVPHDLWLCLGRHGGARGREALERELAPANANLAGRAAALVACARAGDTARLAALEKSEHDPVLLAALARVRAGQTGAPSFRFLDPLRS